VILYDSATGERLPVQMADGSLTDALPILTFTLKTPAP